MIHMLFGLVIVAALCCAGAASENRQLAKQQRRLANEQARHAREAAREQYRLAAEHARQERQAAMEFAEEQARLQREFAKYSTQELRIAHRTYLEFLHHEPGQGDVRSHMGSEPAAGTISSASGEVTARELIRLDRELFRRWKAGDAEAYLASFGRVENGRVDAAHA